MSVFACSLPLFPRGWAWPPQVAQFTAIWNFISSFFGTPDLNLVQEPWGKGTVISNTFVEGLGTLRRDQGQNSWKGARDAPMHTSTSHASWGSDWDSVRSSGRILWHQGHLRTENLQLRSDSGRVGLHLQVWKGSDPSPFLPPTQSLSCNRMEGQG